MSQLHAVIVEQSTDPEPPPGHAPLAAVARGYRLAAVFARFLVSFMLVGGVALSFAFGDSDRVIAGEQAVSPAR